MSTSTVRENTVPLKDRNLGFFSLGRKNVSTSNSFISDLSQTARHGYTLRKAWSQADSISTSLSQEYRKLATPKQWNQPTGLVSQILQEKRNLLLENLKQKVKILAEESVTRNFVHEQSSNIIAFCAAVEDCLRFGLALKRPVLFNREPPTYCLLKEVAKTLPEAHDVVRRVQEMGENMNSHGGYGNAFNLTPSGYIGSTERNPSTTPGIMPRYLWIRIALFQKSLDKIADYLVENAESYYERVSIISHPFDGHLFADLLRGPCTHDYTRIRTSDHLWTDPSAGELMQRKMIYSAGVKSATRQPRELMVHHQQQMDERQSFLRTHLRLSVESGIGPTSSVASANYFQPSSIDAACTFFLHFEPDHISPASLLYHVSSPSAIIHNSKTTSTTESVMSKKRADEGLAIDGYSTNDESRYFHYHHRPHSIFPSGLAAQKLMQAKDYVESLHQNERSPLLYGKNNVFVQSSMSAARISGYLSMHKTISDENSGLQLKWAPNRAMSVPQNDGEKQQMNQSLHDIPSSHKTVEDTPRLMLKESSYWDFALDIDIKKVVYIHCHRHHLDNHGGTVVLVQADGVQYPPLTFPSFSQIVSFMQCLEMHLAPKMSLNPPTDSVDWYENSGPSRSSPLPMESASGMLSSPSLETPPQFCFRIDISETPIVPKPVGTFRMFASTLRSSPLVKTLSMEDLAGVEKSGTLPENLRHFPVNAMDAFSNTYHTMQNRILSRVFNGWLAYTRSINLIRNRLKKLVYPRYIMPKPPPLDAEPLTVEFWQNMRHLGGKTNHIREVYERVYFGGCDPAIRREVWPFLLGHYPWTATETEIEEIDRRTRMAYERSVSEWLAAEVIIMQQHHRSDSVVAAEAQRTLVGQHTPLIRSRGASERRKSLSSDRQTVEEILSDAWNKVKRRISTATAQTSKQLGDVNGNPSASHPPTSSTRSINGLPPLPPKGNHGPRGFKADNSAGYRNSVDLTDEETEDCTLTTTDDDDVECAAAANRVRRLAMARAQSCPNSPQFLDHRTAPIRITRSSAVDQEDTSDIDDVFGAPILTLEQTDGHTLQPPIHSTKEKRQSRYSHVETLGVSYSDEVLEALSVNIQRIDKDVARCDRNYYYFSKGLSNGNGIQAMTPKQSTGGLCVASLDLSSNLYRLRTIMCTWIWQHLETGYVQGMCDLLAPLLVVLEDEALTYACFSQLMLTMLANFPLGSGTSTTDAGAAATAGVVLPHLLEPVVFEPAPHRRLEFTRPKTKQQLLQEAYDRGTNGPMILPPGSIPVPAGSTRINRQFESLRSLIEVLDPVLTNHMHLNEDNSHLYFYRWLLLDFKREFKYTDVFLVWETIWTSYRLVCPDFEIFIAFALIQYYRDIIIFYCFDYTDIIRFYNVHITPDFLDAILERAEQHDLQRLLNFARDLIYRLQSVISSISPKSGLRSKGLKSEK